MKRFQVVFVETRLIMAYVDAKDHNDAREEVLRYPNQQEVAEQLDSKVMLISCEEDE